MNKKFSFVISFFLIFIASFLFMLANPSFVNSNGLGFIAFIYFLPVLIVIHNQNYKSNIFFGFLYGFLSYFLYAFWLVSYGVLIQSLLCVLYGAFWSVLFCLLKFADSNFNKYGFLIQFLIILSFEFIKTKGFLGFGYGISGYTQWQNLYLIQIANLFGVFGVSAIVIFPSCLMYEIYKKIKNHQQNFLSVLFFSGVWILLFCATLLYGKNQIKKNENVSVKSKVSVIAIQNNEDPWGSGFNHYRSSIQQLINITNEALENYPEVDIVVWPETAVVPSVSHFYDEEKSNRKLLIEALMHYFESKDCNFLIGNGFSEFDNINQKIYNSALFFEQDKNILPPKPVVYSKNHLVPFSEHLPFGIKSNFLEKNFDFHFWNEGQDVIVFEDDDFCFGTPICFEDTFDDIPRKMKNKGANFFISLINDSWGNSFVCQNQHLAISVFRAVENKLPLVRCTVSGQTCYISSCGKIENLCEPFTQTYNHYEIPIFNDYSKTLFSKLGNLFIYVVVIICFILLLNKFIFVIIKKVGK